MTEPLLRSKMPELDSVRGIAVLAVVLYHGFFWSNNLVGLSGIALHFVSLTRFGWLGVHLFFILSGFLITGILEDSKSQLHYFRSFYVRRALRILPAFYGFLLVLAFIPSQGKPYLLLSFFYLSNFAPIFHVRDTYPMFWSLAAEEHYYLLWPLIVWLLSRRALLFAASFLFLFSPILRGLWFHDPLPEGFHGFTWLVMDGFGGGAILALLIREPWCTRKMLSLFGWLASLAAMLMLILGSPIGMLSRRNLIGAALLLSAAHLLFAGGLALILLAGTSRLKFLVNFRVLSFYGEISYGLYLIQWLVFFGFDALAIRYMPRLAPFQGNFPLLTIRFLCVVATATLLAWLSRWYYEERFLKLKSRFA